MWDIAFGIILAYGILIGAGLVLAILGQAAGFIWLIAGECFTEASKQKGWWLPLSIFAVFGVMLIVLH